MKNIDFIAKVNVLIGTAYDSCDCKDVIAKSLGIRFAGTNWLFRSIKNSSKYRYLVERHVCGDGTTPPPGAVTFMVDEGVTPKGYDSGPNAYHCGVVDVDGYVIHSSPKTGVRKDMTSHWTEWNYWGLMKQVEYIDEDVSSDNGDGVIYVDFHGDHKTLTDRELLERIYRAVVRD